MNRIFNCEFLISHSTRKARQWVDKLIAAPDAFAWIVFAAVAANTLAYIVMFSNPVIRSDAWYFLDVFLRKALDGTLHFGDFFVQRGGMDHAQPLRKLILLIDLRYFDLDFRYEAMAGWCAAMVSLVLLRRLVFWHEDTQVSFTGIRVWIWAGLCVTFVSLNSTDVWGWPLVTGNFTSYVLLFATLLSLWRWLSLGRPALLLICALTLDIAADDTAMLANIACLLTLGIMAWQNPMQRMRALKGAAMLVTCLIIARIVYTLSFTPPEGFHMDLGKRLGNLWSYFIDDGWWQWAVVPLASSIGAILPLKHFAGEHARTLQVLTGLGLLLGHGWFWWRVLWKRPAITAPAFAAIVLMLLFYALLAGIIYARVSIFGNNYLNQPRYVLAYSINIIALLLMCASCRWGAPTGSRSRFARTAFVMLMTLLIAWQIPLTRYAWAAGPYVKAYQQKMAWQLGEMSRQPDRTPEHCAPELIICNSAPDKRARLIGILKSHQLNVFSPRFKRATLLDPDRPPQ